MNQTLPRFRLTPMRPRDPHQPGRTASTLELFFDLVFVVAVSNTAGQLHHALSEAHTLPGLLTYGFCFFAIWWAWMNFTWFATSFDTDDWLYRLVTIVQMSGVLILAAGVERAFVEHDFTILALGYVVMRFAMVSQWLRAYRNAGDARRSCLIYAGGIAGVQVLWVLMLLLPHEIQWFCVPILALAEISVPVIAEQTARTPWHPHHITERYGLFTLILLGESLLASANAIIEALHEQEALSGLLSISVLTLVVTASLWWIYFWPPHHTAITTFASSLRYGYVHLLVFAAAGAFSAGIEVLIDVSTHHSKISYTAASFAVSIPVAVFVLGIWWIALRKHGRGPVNVAIPIGVLMILIDPLLPGPLAISAVVLIALVAVLVIYPPRDVETDH